jgi:hypothetical protein
MLTPMRFVKRTGKTVLRSLALLTRLTAARIIHRIHRLFEAHLKTGKLDPVILPPQIWPLWLGEDAGEPEQLKAVGAALPGGRHGLLVRERACRQRHEQ